VLPVQLGKPEQQVKSVPAELVPQAQEDPSASSDKPAFPARTALLETRVL
jgi:hypothetical protein